LIAHAGARETPAEPPEHHRHHQPAIPVAKFRFDVGQIAKHILSPTPTAEADCKHLSLIVEGLDTQLRVATLTHIADLISGTKPADILPLRIDVADVRLTLQVRVELFPLQHCRDANH